MVNRIPAWRTSHGQTGGGQLKVLASLGGLLRMRIENEEPAGRTRPQIREPALRRGGLTVERSSGRCWSLLMHHWLHGACDMWQSMRLCITTWPYQMCAATRNVRQPHADPADIRYESASRLSRRTQRDTEPRAHHLPPQRSSFLRLESSRSHCAGHLS